MTNCVVLFLLNDQLYLETNTATEIFGGQVSRLSNLLTYCHVLFNRSVLSFLSVHLFVLTICVTSLTPFQRERTNDFNRSSERHDVDVIYKCYGFKEEQIIINVSYQDGKMFRFDASKKI